MSPLDNKTNSTNIIFEKNKFLKTIIAKTINEKNGILREYKGLENHMHKDEKKSINTALKEKNRNHNVCQDIGILSNEFKAISTMCCFSSL